MIIAINHKGYEILIADEKAFGLPKPDNGTIRAYYANKGFYMTALIPAVLFKEENSKGLSVMLDNLLIDWFRQTLQ